MGQINWSDASGNEIIWVDESGNEIVWSDGKATTSQFVNSGFPPSTNTSLQNIIPSYLFVQYNDDDTLQAFVSAYNQYAQSYLTLLNSLTLGVYTQAPITGALLDWVAQGVYGIVRPALPSTLTTQVGPLNTYGLNASPSPVLNTLIPAAYSVYYYTNDDIFRRVITWNFYKGDGFVFTARWLKRRVMRFLFGPNGVSYNVDQTYPISVTYTSSRAITITINRTLTQITAQATYNNLTFNQNVALNTFAFNSTSLGSIPAATIFKAAVAAGVLNLPFQYSYTVNI